MKLHLPKGLRAALLACMGLISPLATTLSGVAAFAYTQAEAEEFQMVLPGNGSITLLGNALFSGEAQHTADAAKTAITAASPSGSAWYWGTGQPNKTPGNDVSVTGDDLTLVARSGYSGEWVMACMSALDGTTGLSVSFTPDSKLAYSMYTASFNTETNAWDVTRISPSSSTASADLSTAGTEVNLNFPDLTCNRGDYILLVFGTQCAGGKTNGAYEYVNDISFTATLSNCLVWNGASGDSWDLSSLNWSDEGTPSAFTDGGTALFKAGLGTVQVTESLSASQLLSKGNYTFVVSDGATLSLGTVSSSGNQITFGGEGTVTVSGQIDGNVNVTGGSLTAGVIHGSLNVSGGSVSLSGTQGTTLITGPYINISNGGVLSLDAESNNGTSAIASSASVVIGAGGTLILKSHDVLGWSASPSALALLGEEGNKAVLTINDISDSNPNSLTLKSNLVLKGYSLVNTDNAGTSFGTWGTTVSASGTDNTIAVDIKVRKQVEFAVSGELTIASQFVNGDDSGTILKTGNGTMIIDNKSDNPGNCSRAFTVRAGTLLLKEGASIGSGDLTIDNGATLKTNGNVTLGNAITANGHINVASGSTLTANGNISLASTAYNQGTMSLGGTVTVDLSDANLINFDSTLTEGTAPAAGTNGWITDAKYTYTIVKNTGTFTGTLTGSDGRTVTQSGDDYVYVGDAFGTTYLVQAPGTTNLSDLMSGDFASEQPQYVQVNAGSILDMTSTTPATFALMGAGAVALNLAAPATDINGATLSSAWTGTVTLTGGSSASYAFDNFVNGSKSLLEFNGFTGWYTTWAGINDYNVKLTDNGSTKAWTNGAYSQSVYTATFSGKWSGTGTFVANISNSGTRYMNYTYSGDIAEWTGKFELQCENASSASTLTFSGNAKDVNIDILRTSSGGILSVVVDTDATFSKSVSADKLTINVGKTAIFKDALKVTTLTANAQSELRSNSAIIGTYVGSGSSIISGNSNIITNLNTSGGVKITGDSNIIGTMEDNGSSLISGNENFITTLEANGATTLTGSDNRINTLEGTGKLVSSGTTEILNSLEKATSVEVTGGTLKLAGMSDGSGSVSVKKGATLSLMGDTVSTAGTISLEEGAVLTNVEKTSLGGTVEGSGSLKVTNGNSLTIAGSASFGSTIENDGTLSLGTNGSLSFSSLDKLDKQGTSYHDSTPGAIAGNGYESGVYLVVKGSGTIGDLASVSVDGTDFTVTIDGSNATITNVGTGGLYYINSGDVTYGGTDNAADAATTTGLVLDGGNLVMDKALVATEGITLKQDASLTINEGVTLDKVTIESGNLKLKGSGVYNISDVTEADVAATQVDGTWAGTINLSDSIIGSLANLDNLAASGSTLNLSGAVTASSGTTIANMELKEGSTLSLSGAGDSALSGTGDSVFSGTLKGSGSISYHSSGTVSFTGNITDWTGSYKGTDSTVKFADNTTVNATISGKSMELGNGAYLNKGATLTGNMTAPAFTLGGSLTVGGDMTATSITIGDGVLENLGTNTTLINVSGSLTGINFVLGDSNWAYLLTDALGEGAAYKLAGFGSSTGSFTLGGASSYVKDGVKFYIEATDSAVTLTKVTMGPEWVGDTTVGWTESDGFNPQQSPDGPVCFMGNGSALVQVHGAQTVTGINVDAESGVTTYTLTGDSVTTNTLSIIHGNLIIQNELTANGLISIHSGTELTVNKEGTLIGGSMTNDGTLTIGSDSTVTVGSISGDGKVAGDGTLVVLDGKVSEKTLSTNAGTIEMDTLDDADATLGLGVSGTLLVRKGGSYTGTYNGATSIGTVDAGAVQTLRADADLTVIGNVGTIDLTGLNDADSANNQLGGLKTTGATVQLNNETDAGAPTKVTLGSASSMEGGVLDFTVSATEVNNKLSAAKENKPTVITGEKLDLSNVTLKVHEVQNENLNLALGGQEKDIHLFVVSDNDDSTANNVTVDMDDCSWMTKYFTNFRVVQGSVNVIGDANTGLYAAHGQTPNGTAGLALAGKAMYHVDPQTRTPGSELAQVLDMLDAHIESGNKGAMDKLGAALAGSSLSAVGPALADDVQRQLRAIRNRTTTMGVNKCVVNEDMPYVNGWISSDGNYRQLSESGTDAGYQLSSWGGTVGVDVDVNPDLTLGMAVSAIFGDYTGKAADTLTGDLDTQYVSFFARVSTGSWVNTFVGTLGRADVDLERTIPGIAGKTTYKTDGMMFGFLYEVARTFALNEDASTCVQPLFNMSFSHTSLDSATEGGTADTCLTTDSASLTQFSLGLGGRLQSIVGENVYNRTSIFEARALLKLDLGDRYNKLNTALGALPSTTVTTRSNEKGVIGAEVGATLTIPLSQDAGAIFFDVNADFNAGQTSVNGSVGYRINF